MTVLVPRLETLPTQQRAIWPQLKPAARLGFVLYGGTAVALRLGHRQSIDFDFVTERSLDFDMLYDAMPFSRAATVIQREPNALTVLSALAGQSDNLVKISFFGPVRTGRVGVPQFTDDGVLAYGLSFQPSESLKAMTYFEGGDLHQLSRQDRLVLVDAAKAVRAIPDVEILDKSLSVGAV